MYFNSAVTYRYALRESNSCMKHLRYLNIIEPNIRQEHKHCVIIGTLQLLELG